MNSTVSQIMGQTPIKTTLLHFHKSSSIIHMKFY